MDEKAKWCAKCTFCTPLRKFSIEGANNCPQSNLVFRVQDISYHKVIILEAEKGSGRVILAHYVCMPKRQAAHCAWVTYPAHPGLLHQPKSHQLPGLSRQNCAVPSFMTKQCLHQKKNITRLMPSSPPSEDLAIRQ